MKKIFKMRLGFGAKSKDKYEKITRSLVFDSRSPSDVFQKGFKAKVNRFDHELSSIKQFQTHGQKCQNSFNKIVVDSVNRAIKTQAQKHRRHRQIHSQAHSRRSSRQNSQDGREQYNWNTVFNTHEEFKKQKMFKSSSQPVLHNYNNQNGKNQQNGKIQFSQRQTAYTPYTHHNSQSNYSQMNMNNTHHSNFMQPLMTDDFIDEQSTIQARKSLPAKFQYSETRISQTHQPKRKYRYPSQETSQDMKSKTMTNFYSPEKNSTKQQYNEVSKEMFESVYQTPYNKNQKNFIKHQYHMSQTDNNFFSSQKLPEYDEYASQDLLSENSQMGQLQGNYRYLDQQGQYVTPEQIELTKQVVKKSGIKNQVKKSLLAQQQPQMPPMPYEEPFNHRREMWNQKLKKQMVPYFDKVDTNDEFIKKTKTNVRYLKKKFRMIKSELKREDGHYLIDKNDMSSKANQIRKVNFGGTENNLNDQDLDMLAHIEKLSAQRILEKKQGEEYIRKIHRDQQEKKRVKNLKKWDEIRLNTLKGLYNISQVDVKCPQSFKDVLYSRREAEASPRVTIVHKPKPKKKPTFESMFDHNGRPKKKRRLKTSSPRQAKLYKKNIVLLYDVKEEKRKKNILKISKKDKKVLKKEIRELDMRTKQQIKQKAVQIKEDSQRFYRSSLKKGIFEDKVNQMRQKMLVQIEVEKTRKKMNQVYSIKKRKKVKKYVKRIKPQSMQLRNIKNVRRHENEQHMLLGGQKFRRDRKRHKGFCIQNPNKPSVSQMSKFAQKMSGLKKMANQQKIKIQKRDNKPKSVSFYQKRYHTMKHKKNVIPVQKRNPLFKL